jgi:hypothetical protein
MTAYTTSSVALRSSFGLNQSRTHRTDLAGFARASGYAFMSNACRHAFVTTPTTGYLTC